MGKLSRTKGCVFERAIARKLRERWPDVEVRRSSQAERAYNSDVFVTGHPVLERLWLELQDARKPTPLEKLRQAERDIAARSLVVKPAYPMRPIIVWHRIRERDVHVTTRLWVVDSMRKMRDDAYSHSVVTMTFDTFFDLVFE